VQILSAEYSGFCFGVKRAIQIALDASVPGKPVYTIGALIHSPQMVEELKAHGITIAEHPEELKNSIVVIRSHGIAKSIKEMLIEHGNQLIDATCPYVSKAQENVSQLCADGFPVVILGDKTHPEVIAMQSYCNQEIIIVNSPDELPERAWQQLGVISQTTKSLAVLQDLVSKLIPKVRELRVFNTICTATTLRQEAAVSLAKKSDLMIVIGGRNSSNTRMLATLCSGITETFHVETAEEISPSMLTGHHKIGLTAGASTPDYLIVNVYNRINDITGDRTTVKSAEDIPVNKEESC
jgi:(E)-4-hydroxy-3-methyl-but-2-enyl pyrophosphate reductase